MRAQRRERILHLVCEAYIDSAEPVASSRIAQRLGCSPATVRSELAALDEAGLLLQPHTSAGRIPTAEGFATYARHLLPPRPLPSEARTRLRVQLAARTGRDLLRTLLQAASELSGYAVVLEVPADGRVRALEVHLTSLSTRRVLAVAVLENGLTRDVPVDLDPTPTAEVLHDAERLVRELALPLADMPHAIRHRARTLGREVRRTLLALADAWPALHPAERMSRGLRLLFDEPESNDPSFLRRAATLLEEGPDAPPSDEDGLDLRYDEDVAMIGTPLALRHGTGRLTLIGPARMRYGQAFSVANGVARHSARSWVQAGGVA